MWSFFGGSSSNNAKSKELPKKAIVELREHINLLTKKQTHLQTQLITQENEARKFLSLGNKTLALNSLKKKKIYENQLNKLDGQIDSLEQQLFSIESANLNLETLRAMKQGSKAMKAIHTGMDIDKVDETMDDIREQVELGEEISDAISRPMYSGMNDIDEDELDEELDMLAQEETAKQIGNIPITEPIETNKINNERVSDLPNVPVNKISPSPQHNNKEEEEEEDEDERALKELQAEMGL
ncbi:similar to Saccharomyces cerevisiae YLR025W SNF7 One of four subunits of the endosomal sorting complex required for transport III (ESCRT-III) [Maudiozyma saulgeensis]|uniref:Vacuolar-sorting protein SNF7 n=1 Tax=Maudiozyma saulgeensis TaxID=1789683 RepID=A0A1X7R0Q4_9SACH|nr:similar to Saccharomyces cerevisiae YLR025W SNF7 One of four subunits of the endosomal sorting complex required for transport III (ESCRT-III) [Kazachstania saulgeensis]